MEAARSRVPLAAERASGRGNPLLRLASDERLVARVRAGSEPAFAELYERYYRKILSFCRHMLGSQEEGEDAVQQTFINAYRDILRSDKELHFRPWLYRIARNQSLSMLRARRAEMELSEAQPSLVGLSDEVAARGDLRDLLRDLGQLPTEQREALVLAELHDNSHAEVAEIIGCDKEKVKSLVFQARSSLIKSRQAREVSCEEIRHQLGILRGGSLRRNVIRRHLKDCEGCRAFHRDVKRQRQALAIILPVIPSAALKLGAGTAMAAVGAKAAGAAAGGAAASGVTAGGAAAGGATVAGAAAGGATGAGVATGAAAGGATAGGTAAASGPFAAVAAKLGVSAVAVKGAVAAATVSAVVAGGTVGENVTRDLVRDKNPPASRSPAKGDKGTAGKSGRGPGTAAGGAPGAASGRKREEGSRSDRARRSRRARRDSRGRRNREGAGHRRGRRGRDGRGDRRRRAHDPRRGRDGDGVRRPAPSRPRRTSPPRESPSGSPQRAPLKRPGSGTTPAPRTRGPKPGGDSVKRGRRRRKASPRRQAGRRRHGRGGAGRGGKSRGRRPSANGGGGRNARGASTRSASHGK